MLGKNNIIKFNTFDATATAEQVLTSYIAYNKNGKITGSMPNIGSDNQTLSINGSYTIPKGYHDGNGKITQSIPTKDSEIYIPTTSDQTIASGKYLSGIQTIKGDSNLIAENIKSGVSIFGINGNCESGTRIVKCGKVGLTYKWQQLELPIPDDKPKYFFLSSINSSSESFLSGLIAGIKLDPNLVGDSGTLTNYIGMGTTDSYGNITYNSTENKIIITCGGQYNTYYYLYGDAYWVY